MKIIKTLLMSQRIKCFKYNSSINDPTCFYEATIKISKDGNELIITNKQVIAGRKYIGTTDPKEVLANTKEYLLIKRGV